MRIVAWNIRAGGGRRSDGITAQLVRWRADVAVLSEFRATEPSLCIAASLAARGLSFQRTTSDPRNHARNALLVASRWPLRRLPLAHAPHMGHRWLAVNVAAPHRFAVLALHVPNRSSGHKDAFLDSVTRIVSRWRGASGLLIGDTNSGRIRLDEESSAFDRLEDGWMQGLAALGWQDAFRVLHGERREFTWYSPNGNNGFRLDQGFLHPRLVPGLRGASHHWGGHAGNRRDTLSDHAALVLDLDLH